MQQYLKMNAYIIDTCKRYIFYCIHISLFRFLLCLTIRRMIVSLLKLQEMQVTVLIDSYSNYALLLACVHVYMCVCSCLHMCVCLCVCIHVCLHYYVCCGYIHMCNNAFLSFRCYSEVTFSMQ